MRFSLCSYQLSHVAIKVSTSLEQTNTMQPTMSWVSDVKSRESVSPYQGNPDAFKALGYVNHPTNVIAPQSIWKVLLRVKIFRPPKYYFYIHKVIMREYNSMHIGLH